MNFYFINISLKKLFVENIFKFDPGKIYKLDLNKKFIKLKNMKYYSFKEKK